MKISAEFDTIFTKQKSKSKLTPLFLILDLQNIPMMFFISSTKFSSSEFYSFKCKINVQIFPKKYLYNQIEKFSPHLVLRRDRKLAKATRTINLSLHVSRHFEKKAFNAGSRLIQSERRGWPPWPEERASFLWATLYANSLFDHKKIDLLLLYITQCSVVSDLLFFCKSIALILKE